MYILADDDTTDNVTVLRGEDPPLTRYVIIGFDDVQKAKTRWDSEDWKRSAPILITTRKDARSQLKLQRN
jgi:uncharacterized protein (DUF1330 family)